MRPRRFVALKLGLLVVVALVLQMAAVADLPVLGAVGDLLLLLTVAVAFVDGPDQGATVGFAAGVAYDLVLDTPFGLSALVYAIVGFLVGMVGASLLRPAAWWPVGLAVIAGFVATGLYAGVGRLIGTPYPMDDLPVVALVVAVWNAALVLPVTGLIRRALGRRESDSVLLAVSMRTR